MKCPLCGGVNENLEHAKHLPHFYRCSACKGFFNLEPNSNPVYPTTYFADETAKETLLQKCLKIFLWLRFKTICRYLPNTQGSILDYGCGNGKLVKYLRTCGLNVEGYDPSSGAVDLANSEGLPVFSKIPEKAYDLIMFWHSLEHTDHPLQDLQNIGQYLKPNGKLLIAVPNGDSLESHLFHKAWFCYDWPFHRVHFTTASLRNTLRSSGFNTISVDYLNPEYTISSLAQSFLNTFLPKNALYGIAANRRSTEHGERANILIGFMSIFLLLVFSPILVIFFLIAFFTKRPAAVIVAAEKSK